MQRRRIQFLPAFFTILGVAFVIALYLRIRTYDTAQQPGGRAGTARTGTVLTGTDGVMSTPAETMTIVENAPVGMRPNASAPPGVMIDPSLRVAVEEEQNATRQQPSEQPQKQAAKPSLVSRIVNPIVNALGGGSRSQNPSGAQNASSRQPGSGSSSSQPSRDGGDKDRKSVV